MKDAGMIFMFHRFADPDFGVSGHSPIFLRRALGELRRLNVEFVPLMELLRRGREGHALAGCAAFTVDDGYADFHRIGATLFDAMDCPVTVFLPTGFIDDPKWFWWDRLGYICIHATKRHFELEVAGKRFEARWTERAGWRELKSEIAGHLRSKGPESQWTAVRQVEEYFQVDVPDDLPESFRPMSWNQIREQAARGVSFGPHSVTHPNMRQLSLAEARAEIRTSWDRVRSEVPTAIPVFCYPYGGPENLAPGGESLLPECGMEGALTSISGYVSSEKIRRHSFRLLRFPWPDRLEDLRQVGSGFERVRRMIRMGARSR
jgi:peptidoglycan/xylan/chitin deacetylase (PgdA/CDA1 family)